jgi:hypothetical protein
MNPPVHGRTAILYSKARPTQSTISPAGRRLRKNIGISRPPLAEATDLRKDLWLTSLNCGSLSEANSPTQINKGKLTALGVRMAEWLRPGLWEVLMIKLRGIEPGQILITKKPTGESGAKVTSSCNCGRRKPNFKSAHGQHIPDEHD